MAKQNAIELILDVKNKGQKNLDNYKKELVNLKKVSQELSKSMAQAKKEISKGTKDQFVKQLGKDSEASAKKIAQLEKRIESLAKANKKAKKETDKATKSNEESVASLRGLANATSTVLGPLNSVSARFNTLNTGAKRFGLGAAALAAGVATLAFTVPKATIAFAEFEAQLGQIEAQLKATGNASGFTTGQLEDFAQNLAKNTLASLQDVRQAISTLLTFPNIRNNNFTETLETAQDVAAATGRGIVTVTETLGKALADPIQGLSSLRRIGVTFTEDQEALVKRTFALNGALAAQAEVLKVLESQYAGAAAGAAQGLAGVLDTIGQRFENILASIGSLVNDSGLLQWLDDAVQSFESLTRSLSAGEGLYGVGRGIVAWWENLEDLDEAASKLGELQKILKRNNDEIERGNKLQQLQKEDRDLSPRVKALNEEFETVKKLAQKEANEQGKVSEKTAKKLKEIQKRANDEVIKEKQRLEDFIRNSDEDSFVYKVRLLEEAGKISKKEADLQIKAQGDDTAFFLGRAPDFSIDTTNFQNISKLYKEHREEIVLIAANSTDKLSEIAKSNTDVLTDSYNQSGQESLKINEENNRKLAEQDKIQTLERTKQDLKIKKDALNKSLKTLAILEKKGTLTAEEREKKLSLESEREANDLLQQRLNLLIKGNKAQAEVLKLRRENPKLSDELIKKLGKEGEKFSQNLFTVEQTKKEIESINKKLEDIPKFKALELEVDSIKTQKDVEEQGKRLTAEYRKQGEKSASSFVEGFKESLDSQKRSIDAKFDEVLRRETEKALEKGGELSPQAITVINDARELEKASATYKNLQERFADLKKEFVDGKINLDSFTQSVKIINSELLKLEKQTGKSVEKFSDDFNDALIKGSKKRFDAMKSEVKTIKKVIESKETPSEAFLVKQEAIERLRTLKKELIEIQKLNPSIELDNRLFQVDAAIKDIATTYDQTTQAVQEIAEDFADGLADGIVQMANEGGTSLKNVLLQAGTEAFGNFASKQIEKLIKTGMTNGINSVLQSDTFNTISEGFGSVLESVGLGFLGDLFDFTEDNVVDTYITNADEISGTTPAAEKEDKSSSDKLLDKATKGLGGKLEDILKKLKPGEGEEVSGLLGLITGPIYGLIQGFRKVFDGLFSAEEGAGPVDFLSGIFGSLFDLLRGATGFEGFFASLSELSKTFFGGLKDIFSGSFGEILDSFKLSFEGLGLDLDGIFEKIKGIFDFDFPEFGLGEGGKFEGLFGQFEGFLQKLLSGLLTPFRFLSQGFDGLLAGVFHSGGIVGASGGTTRMVNPAAFANPSYYHSGGIVGTNLKQDEVAAVLQKGEMVIDKNTTQNMMQNKGGGASGNITIQNLVGPEDTLNALKGSQSFGNEILNQVRANADEFKNILR